MSDDLHESCDDADDLGERLAALRASHKELKERVERSETRRSSLAGAAVALILAAFGASRYVVLLEGRVDHLERRLDRRETRDLPADPFPLLPLIAPPAADAAEDENQT